MQNYDYPKKHTYYADSNVPQQREDELLAMLPRDHPYNDHKKSNYRGGPGHVYLIDMQS